MNAMSQYTIPNLKNACHLLVYLSRVQEAMTISELASSLQLPRTSVLRIVQTLHDENFLRKEGNRFSLGSALVALGTKVAGNIDLREYSRPVLAALRDATEETCHLAVWDDGRVLITEVASCAHPLSAASTPGTRAYVHCSATGKVLLAFCFFDSLNRAWPKKERAKLTTKSVTDVDTLKRRLSKVKKDGYALDDEEYYNGVRCLAAPVYDETGKVCAALGITASCTRFTRGRITQVAHKVMDAAFELSQSLGYSKN